MTLRSVAIPAWPLVVAGLLALGGPPAAGSAMAEPAVRRGACQPAEYGAPAGTAEDEAEADGDDASDADEGAQDDAGSADPTDNPVGVALGADGCLTIGGSLTAGLAATQRRFDDQRLQALAGSASRSFEFGGSASVSTAWTVGGVFVGTTFSLSTTVHPVAAATVTEASIRVDRLLAGYAPSTFNYWTAEIFAGAAFAPQRATFLAAFDIVKPGPWSLTLSVEDPRIAAPDDPGVPPLLPGVPAAVQPDGSRRPDVILRLRRETDDLGLHAAAAFRPAGSGASTNPGGWAATFGWWWSFPAAGITHTLSGQVTYAANMPTYLGTQFDARSLRAILRPDDVTRGASLVASWTQEWTRQITTGVYVSHVALSFPTIGARGGTARMTRAAANITYRPVPAISLSAEIGYGRAAIGLPDRLIQPFATSGQSWTGTLTTAVTF